jgi:ribonuclease VapC
VITVDASAVLAILLAEPEGAHFEALLNEQGGVMSAVNYWEVLVRARKAGGQRGKEVAEALVRKLGIEICPTEADDARRAADVFERFGRGTPAGLNLGDCFAYALADREDEGLPFKGNDFSKTDIKSALI